MEDVMCTILLHVLFRFSVVYFLLLAIPFMHLFS
jgi:hypothetical protein